jgi:hypothetical protein
VTGELGRRSLGGGFGEGVEEESGYQRVRCIDEEMKEEMKMFTSMIFHDIISRMEIEQNRSHSLQRSLFTKSPTIIDRSSCVLQNPHQEVCRRRHKVHSFRQIAQCSSVVACDA